MWFRSLIDSLARSPRHRKERTADRKQRARRLLLEGLEDRSLLAFNFLAEYPVGPGPSDLILAPIDADDHLDVVTANSGGFSVSFLPGNGNGTFELPATTSATVAPPRALAAGDFDGDGVADLIAADTNLALLKGNGDGSFQTPVAIPIPPQPISGHPEAGLQTQYLNSVAIGDLNEDGYLDLVATGNTSWVHCPYGCYFFGDGYVNVLIGNGDGGFAPAVVRRLGQSLGPVAVDDLNQDGRADVITVNNGHLSVLLGDGTGALGSPVDSGSGTRLSSLSLGDIDGDSILDTVLRWGGGGLTVQKGRGDGTFVPSTSVWLGWDNVDSAVVGDVNADGKLDLVAVGSPHTCTDPGYYCYAGFTSQQATVVLGNGLGGFLLPTTSLWGTVDGTVDTLWYSDLALADVTGDGLPDVVAVEQTTGVAVVAEGSWLPPDAPALTIEVVSVVEGDTGSALVSIAFSLSAAYSQAVTANYQTIDGTASAGSDYVSSSGSLTFAPGDRTQTITLEVRGDRLPEADESLSIVLSNVVNALVANVGTVTILDNEPRISIDHSYNRDPLTVVEGDGGTTPAVFTVTLARPYDQEATVDYYTLTGHTADIVAASGTLRFAPGQTSQTITVQVVNDLIPESLEAFNVILTNPSSNATIVNEGYCYIADNDWAPKVTISDVKKTEGSKGTKSFAFTINLSYASSQWVYVNFATADGTATLADNDYVATSGTVSFAPGQTTATIFVTVRGDTKKEANETFFVNLTGADGGWISDSQGVGTIANDDGGRSGQSGQSLLAAAVIDDSLSSHRKRK